MSSHARYIIDRITSDPERMRSRALVYTGEYMRTIGLEHAHWEVLKWNSSTIAPLIDFLFFTGYNKEKHDFIFELKGGTARLNEFLNKCYNEELRKWRSM
jgi:hypothetical protein